MLEIHPLANTSRMMTEKEKTTLAASIKSVGQLDPILTWTDPETKITYIIDGRNRYSILLELKIKPIFKELPGDANLLEIVAGQMARRKLTTNERAIAAGEVWDLYEPKRGRPSLKAGNLPAFKGKGDRRNMLGTMFGVSGSYVQFAYFIIEHEKETAELIKNGQPVNGSTALYKIHQDVKDRVEKKKRLDESLDKIRQEDPDLCQQVLDGAKTLEQALDILRERARIHRERCAVSMEHLHDAMNILYSRTGVPRRTAFEFKRYWEPSLFPSVSAVPLTVESMRNCAAVLTLLADMVEGVDETEEKDNEGKRSDEISRSV